MVNLDQKVTKFRPLLALVREIITTSVAFGNVETISVCDGFESDVKPITSAKGTLFIFTVNNQSQISKSPSRVPLKVLNDRRAKTIKFAEV